MLLLWLMACGGGESPRPSSNVGLTIAYTHNVSGEIEPCG